VIGLDDLRAVRLERDGAVATVVLDRPERLNAWTGRMHAEYRAVFAHLEADAGVRAVVVTGAGRGFCAGADARALSGHAAAGGYDPGLPPEPATPGHGVDPDYDHPFAWQAGLRFPVVAAINGPAAGVGLVLACWCDLRFAAADAKLTTSAPRLGLPAEYGLSWILPRLVGTGHAADLLLSSRVVRGDEAERIGLVNRALPTGDGRWPRRTRGRARWPPRSHHRPSPSPRPSSGPTSGARWVGPSPAPSG